MGASLTRTLQRVLPDSGPGSPWARNARGPTLRRLFGAYGHSDLWTVFRRLKEIDPAGSGYLNYEELQRLVSLPDFNLMYLWDLFSQQNELVHGQELLATICVFSSAHLADKARFLSAVFDSSHTGLCTGAELAQLCVSALGVLARCTGTIVKPKEVAAALREELPGLLPEYREALKRRGGDRAAAEKAFGSDRVIGRPELDRLVPTFATAYQDLPVAGAPPTDAIPPPPPAWNEHAPAAAATLDDAAALAASGGGPRSPPAGGGTAAARALAASRTGGTPWDLSPLMTETEVLHLTNEQDRAAAEAARLEAERAAEAARRAAEDEAKARVALPPASARLVIHGLDFADIEKDVAGFRYNFCRGIASALDLPSACVEIASIGQGSVTVDFRLHASGRSGDRRCGEALLLDLEAHLTSASKKFRGKFREYAQTAELRRPGEESPQRPATGGPRRAIRIDEGAQATDIPLTIEELGQLIEAERRRCEAVEARFHATRKQIAERDATIAEMKAAVEAEAQRRREEAELARQREEAAVEAEAQRRREEAEMARQREEDLLRQEAQRAVEEEQRRVEEQRRAEERRAAAEERLARGAAPARALGQRQWSTCCVHRPDLFLMGVSPALIFF